MLHTYVHMMAELEEFVLSLKGLSAPQLMDKKDAIEKDIKEFNDVLQAVSPKEPPPGTGLSCRPLCFLNAARWGGHAWSIGGR